MARRLRINPLTAKSWQSRKILLDSLVVRRGTRIDNPRAGWIPFAGKPLVVVASLESRGWCCCDFLWAFRSDGAMPAHVITVIGLQFAENNRGQNGKPAERDKRLVHSLNHLRRVRGKPIRDKERCN